MSCIPAIETPANIRAAEIATRELNAGYLTVMLEGKYTDAFLRRPAMTLRNTRPKICASFHLRSILSD